MDSASSINPQSKLHSLKGLVVASLLGSLVSGAVLVFLNYSAFNRRKSGIRIAGVIVVIWFLSMTPWLFIPEFPGDAILIMATQALLMLAISRKLFGASFEKYEAENGIYHSIWRSAGIAILVSLALFATVMIIFVLTN